MVITCMFIVYQPCQKYNMYMYMSRSTCTCIHVIHSFVQVMQRIEVSILVIHEQLHYTTVCIAVRTAVGLICSINLSREGIHEGDK